MLQASIFATFCGYIFNWDTIVKLSSGKQRRYRSCHLSRVYCDTFYMQLERKGKEGKGREWKGKEGKGRERKGKEGKGR